MITKNLVLVLVTSCISIGCGKMKAVQAPQITQVSDNDVPASNLDTAVSQSQLTSLATADLLSMPGAFAKPLSSSLLLGCKNPVHITSISRSEKPVAIGVARGNGHPNCPVENSVYVEFAVGTLEGWARKVIDFGGYATNDPIGVGIDGDVHIFVTSSDNNIHHRTFGQFWTSLGGNVEIFENQCQGKPMVGATSFGAYSPSCLKHGFSITNTIDSNEIYITATNRADRQVYLRTLTRTWNSLGGYATSTPIFGGYQCSGCSYQSGSKLITSQGTSVPTNILVQSKIDYLKPIFSAWIDGAALNHFEGTYWTQLTEGRALNTQFPELPPY